MSKTMLLRSSMDTHEKFMLRCGWAMLGALLIINVAQNCYLGMDCMHPADALLVAWVTGFFTWIFYSGPAFLAFAWTVLTLAMLVRGAINGRYTQPSA